MLPFELISAIIDACRSDVPSLLSWALVSTTYVGNGQRNLYGEITFTSWTRLDTIGPQSHRLLDWTRASQFLETITKNKHLARLVKDLTLAFGDGTWPAILWAAFLRVLPSLTQVERFSVDLGVTTPRSISLERLFRNTTMKLQELALSMHSITSNPGDVAQLLHQQNSLETLSLPGGAWRPPQVSNDACPNLHTVSTSNRRFIVNIVPGRPVVKLCWDLSDSAFHGLHPGIWHCSDGALLAQALSQIRILILEGLEDRGQWLALIAPYLSSLEILELNEHHEKDMEDIVKLQTLRVVIFRARTEKCRQGALVELLLPSLPTLQMVFFASQILDRYLKWMRGMEAPAEVGTAEVASFLAVGNLGRHRGTIREGP